MNEDRWLSCVILTLFMVLTPCQSLAFHWRGSIDCKTGLADSVERSEIRTNSNLERIQSRCYELFYNYPRWLVQRRITFGFLTLKEGSICDSMFGSRLLIFDSPPYIEGFGNTSVDFSLSVLGGSLVNEKGEHAREEDTSFGSLYFALHNKIPQNKDTLSSFELETRIIQFKPSLAGSVPIRMIGKTIYLYSQRIVHAYVMWRYHKYIHTELSKLTQVT